MAVVWNSGDKHADITLSNGDKTASNTGEGGPVSVRANISKSSGKWYWEIVSDGSDVFTGIGTSAAALDTYVGAGSTSYCYEGSAGNKIHSDSSVAYGATYAGQVIGIALDLDNGKIWWAKDNVWQASGDPAAGTNAAYTGISGTFYSMQGVSPLLQSTCRFINTDLTYSPPSGFSALETASTPVTGLLDGKIRIKNSVANLLDGKLGINAPANLLDGKARIKDSATNLFDGELALIGTAVGLLDGKTKITLSPVNSLDGKVNIHRVATDLFSGKLLLLPFFTGEIELSSLTLEAFTGHQGSVELPFLEVLGTGSVGRLGWLEENLPRFNLEARTGLIAAATLPSLSIESIAYLELLGKGNCVLPGFNVSAITLIEILANAGISLPSLRLEAGFQHGIIASGNVNLYPLRLHASGFAGIVGTVDVSLPGLLVDGDLIDNPDCTGAMELSYFIVDADGNVTRDPCLGPYILKHRR